MKENIYRIQKMDCPTEEALIRNRMRGIEGIDRMDFDLIQRRLTVAHRLDNDCGIQTALRSIGMEPVVLNEGAEVHEREEAPTRERVLLGLSGAFALAAEVVAWTTGNERSAVVIGLALLSITLGGRETLKKGLIALRTLTLNINFLMTLAVTGATVIGQWPEAAVVTFLFGLAELIEALSLERARNAVRTLMELSPETAEVRLASGGFETREAGSVEVGQVVRVRPGERVPLDGRVTAGNSSVNQAPITGESIPVEKRVGDAVFAGTINEKGSFEFEVTANRGNTTLARIVRSVQEAQGQRAPTQRFVDRFARYYTPAVVALAVLVAAVPPLAFGQPFLPWLYKALVMLVIACPCALVISTPVTVVSGLAAAARRGILVKGGVYLEEGRRMRALALDKTGTLTHGTPRVTDVVPLGEGSPERLLQLAASLDAPSEHPVASAIVSEWTGANRTVVGNAEPGRVLAVRRSGELLPVEEFASITGRGVKGRIGGRLYFVGNHRLAEKLGVATAEATAALKSLEEQGKTAVVLASESEPLAVVGVADTIRETSVEAVAELHALGIRTVMLTGDNQATASTIAKMAGIDDARGGLLPEDKLQAVSVLHDQHGRVGMVGDGINDAPALAKSDIGFAMGAAGTDTAIETADVALMRDDLRGIPEFVRLSRKTSTVLKQNIALSIGIKVVFFGLALAGVATLWMAVFADMGGSLLVVANGLRLLRHGGRVDRP